MQGEAESLASEANQGRRAQSMEANVMERRKHVKELVKAAEKVEGKATSTCIGKIVHVLAR